MATPKSKESLYTKISLRDAEWTSIVNQLLDYAFEQEIETDEEDCDEALMLRAMARRLDERRKKALAQKLKRVGPR